MANAAAQTVRMVEALADPSRRAIVSALCDRPASVQALADSMPISRPAVSQHLKALKVAGLVSDRAEGTRRIYAVQPDALAAVREYFDDFWQRSMTAFADAADVTADPHRRGGATPEEP